MLARDGLFGTISKTINTEATHGFTESVSETLAETHLLTFLIPQRIFLRPLVFFNHQGLVDNQPEVNAMKPAVQFQDGIGRNLEATIQTDGIEWKLWVNSQTKDAVVSQQSKTEQVRHMHKLTVPAGVVEYQTLLQEFVDKQIRGKL